MPLKLQGPRPGKTPHFTIRGTYLGVYVNESTGTNRREVADRLRRKKERDIERGAVAVQGAATFTSAAIDYMTSGGERQYLPSLLRHFDGVPLTVIDQHAVDVAAERLYPDATAATRNRQVYTPVSAVLKRAGIERPLHRPIGWRGRKLTHWLTPETAFKLFDAALQIKAPDETRIKFRIFLILLCYTGMRLSDGLGIERKKIDLKARSIHLPETKNGEPRLVYLPKIVINELKNFPGGITGEGRLFPFHASGRLRDMLAMTLEIAKVELPKRVAFHVFCYTWATWMRQHAGLDTFDLTRTDRWKDQDSADRYAHVVIAEQSKKAELLPVPGRKKGGGKSVV